MDTTTTLDRPWNAVGALCTAADRDERCAWMHARCSAVGCACGCHGAASAPEAPGPRLTRSIVIPVRCPACAGELSTIATSRPDDPIRQAAVLACESCGAEMQVIVTAAQTKRGASTEQRTQLQRARLQRARHRGAPALTAEDIADAAALKAATGMSNKALAARYGVSEETMRTALRTASNGEVAA